MAAVIFDPVKDELFYAEKGAGAWLNDSQRLRVSGRRRMADAVFAAGLPPDGGAFLPEMLQDLARLMPKCSGMRRYGAAALDLAYVAAGRYDGFWEYRLKPWDIAAGILLVREAGGFVEAREPGADILTSGHLIAANSELFEPFAAELRTA